jgi:protein-tyrosine phosphatase
MKFLETVNFVTPQLAVGGRYFGPRRLRRAGVTHVLSARREPDRIGGFVCLNNPMADDGAAQTTEYWFRTVEFALEVLADPTHKLYVHCAAGKNRGPAHAYAILLALGHPPDEARALIRRTRRKATARYFDDVEAAILEPRC